MTMSLIIVDVQNDFCEGGALAVAGGRKVAERVERYLRSNPTTFAYDRIIASQDWHTPDSDNGGHFSEHPDYVNTWPAHCVQGTKGADLAFASALIDQFVIKGMDEPAYSVLEGVDDMSFEPLEFGPDDDVTVCGIATDYCVKATVLDLLKTGATVRVLTGLCAAVSLEGEQQALTEMSEAGAILV